MPRYRIHGGAVTVKGCKHHDGSEINFEGVPPVGFEPLDEDARRRKLDSITSDLLDARYPQRTMLLAKSLGEHSSTLDRARRSIRDWVSEQSGRHHEAAAR